MQTSRGHVAGKQDSADTGDVRRFTVVKGGLTDAIAAKREAVARATETLRARCEELRQLLERLA